MKKTVIVVKKYVAKNKRNSILSQELAHNRANTMRGVRFVTYIHDFGVKIHNDLLKMKEKLTFILDGKIDRRKQKIVGTC